jgi:pimeloyl-ACP methyl ester carboxylesterase
MTVTEVVPDTQNMYASAIAEGAMAPPTKKYTDYLAEVQEQLHGKLSKRERHRLEYLSSLMQRARFVKLNGIVHHYQEVGPQDGEPVILVHGWDCSALWWHHIVDDLAHAGYRVIIYDLKGHGFSDPDPNQGYTVQGFSDDLKALGEALNLPSYHLISFSLGSAISLHHAAQFSGCVRSLIFFNFGILSDNRFQVAVVVHLLDFVFNKVLRPIERLGLWVIPYVYARLVLAKNTPLVSDAKLGTLGLRWCHPDAVRISAQQLADAEIQQAIPRQMSQVTQPTLLVAGESDPVMLPKNGRKLIEHAPNGTYLEVPRCGHIILFELPELVVQIVRMHLRSVQGSKA